VVLGLFADLPGRFVIDSTQDGEQGLVFRLRSAEVIGSRPRGPLYLRASVKISELADTTAATAEVLRRLAAADPDVGLSYAWDFVIVGVGSVVHLHAACTFSEESFLILAHALTESSLSADPPPAAFWCRCGGGCRAGAPFNLRSDRTARLPPVRRSSGVEDGEYDNRLDPSGAWTSRIGELSLMHYADRLSFVYSAVFGPTAHICEGAGVAGLVGTDRYEYTDDQGTVAFAIRGAEVRMELLDGVASFCGAGWAGDRFRIEQFEPPTGCTVTVPHSYFHVVDHLLPERRPAHLSRGDAIEVVPAPLSGDESWILARFVGRQTTTMGLLTSADVDCAAGTAEERLP
jgi:hypothetical protein